MRHEEVIKGFISSIKPDDPDASSKKLQIERWGRLWWVLADYQNNLDLFVQVLSDKACWDKTEDFYKIKLNINQVGKKLVDPDTTYYNTKHKGMKINSLTFDYSYRIACWCCLEDDICRLFNQELQARSFDSEEEIVDFIEGRNRGPLMIFWSHYINKDKYPVRNRERWTYEYGFECAMAEKHVEALEFFWEKIKLDTTISLEKKEQLLFNVAFYKSINGYANVEMIEFCLRYLNPNKYADLLKENFKNNCRNILLELISKHSLEKTKQLFDLLNPKDVSYEFYTDCLMYGTLRYTISLPYDDLVNTRNELTVYILNHPEFTKHKEHFLDSLGNNFSASREDMVTLIKIGRSGAVWDILNLANKNQIKSIMKSENFRDLDKLVNSWGDSDSANKIIEFLGKAGSDVLNRNKPSDELKNTGHLTQSISMSTDKKEYSTENIPSSSQSSMPDASGDFVINKTFRDLS